MKTLKFILLSTFISLMVSSNVSLNAATLHAILVCDTHAEGIERGVQADYKNITKEIEAICKATNLKKNIKAFTGKKASSDFVKRIDKLDIKSDDAVLFYWSGHGMRFNSQQDPWPVFDFEYPKKTVSQYSVTQKLMKKNPRLILSIADCCNDFIDKSQVQISKKISGIAKENYKTLFLYSSGTYMATSASPGESSFGLNHNDKEMNLPAGGYYTTALLEVLHKETDQVDGTLSWDLIFTLAGEKTEEYQYTDSEDPYVYHHPFFEYVPHN